MAFDAPKTGESGYRIATNGEKFKVQVYEYGMHVCYWRGITPAVSKTAAEYFLDEIQKAEKLERWEPV